MSLFVRKQAVPVLSPPGPDINGPQDSVVLQFEATSFCPRGFWYSTRVLDFSLSEVKGSLELQNACHTQRI